MTANSAKSLLMQTLAPVVLVVTLWIIMSFATTYYLYWVERSHQRDFVENTLSIRAAESLQILVWRMAAECPNDSTLLPEFQTRWKEVETQIVSERQALVETTATDEEQFVMLKLNSSLTAFLDCLNGVFDPEDDASSGKSEMDDLSTKRLRAIEIAGRIAEPANELLKINQALTDRDTLQRQTIGRVVLSSRLAILVVGPLLGVFLGWRLAIRLHRSIARISVTLHDADSSSDRDIGTVAIESSGDVQDVQQQAEQVAERMRQVSRDLQAARREVLQSERLAAVGELAAGVAHEIRNPLTSVKLLLQHAIRQASGPHLDESKVRLILEEIGRMETTIQGLLDFSRPPKLNRVPHDLRQTLRRALNLVDARARQQGIEIAAHFADNPIMVDGDTEKLHQVLVNLLINAVEAMPDGGRLTIDATTEVPRNLRIPTHYPPNRSDGTDERVAQIIIRDTGEGISNDVLPRLFEPFATTKERGTGLGLAVSHRIIEEHSGTILACNGPCGGAQFTLNIPAVAAIDNASSSR